MAFLFGKKKQSHPTVTVARDGLSPGPANPSTPAVNGIKEKDKNPPGPQSSTPTSSVSNSVNSVGGATTPSPEHGGLRGVSDQDGQHGPRPGINGPSMSMSVPGANLYPWSQQRLTFTSSQPNPFPRYGAAVNATSSKEGDVYVMGGLVNGQTVKGDLWMIESGNANLACYPIGTTSEGPGPRVGHASILVGNAFIVFGGDTKQDENDPLDDILYLLNTSTRQWSRAAPPGPRPAGRYGHTLNILGSRLYVFGGQVDGHFFNDLLSFDLNTLQTANTRWEMLIRDANDGGPLHGQAPMGRTNHTVVTYNDRLYLFGGTDGVQWFNDVWTYDPRTNGWSQLDCIGYIPQPREGHSSALVGDVMYVFGGRTEEGNDLGDLAAFRITSRRWYTFQNMGPSPSPRSGHSMTAYGKQIVVLAGEPSSAPRDHGELSLVYILDTAKIKYPNDQPVPQLPAGDRIPDARRPSNERILPSKGMPARDTSNGPNEGPRRKFSGGSREGPPALSINGKGADPALSNGPASIGSAGSRLPRASPTQAPIGPSIQQQAPPLRPNGVMATGPGQRSRTPTTDGRSYGPPVEATCGPSFDRQATMSPTIHESPRGSSEGAMSPITNGPLMQRPGPSQQSTRLINAFNDVDDVGTHTPGMRSPSQQARYGQVPDGSMSDPSQPRAFTPQQHSQQQQQPPLQIDGVEPMNYHNINPPKHTVDPALTQRIESLTQELESTKSRSAWYASELALARSAGYQPNTSREPEHVNDEIPSLDDGDKPLIEALVAIKAELAEVQLSFGSRINGATQKVFEVEQQRDAAIREAAFAKAKYAAHGEKRAETPQWDDSARGLADKDRATDNTRKLASALALQTELRSKLDATAAELEAEKQRRASAEENVEAAHRRATELDQAHNPGEAESLRSELHETQIRLRDEAAQRAEAHSTARLLAVDKEDLNLQLRESFGQVNSHVAVLTTLRDAVAASHDKSTHLESKLDEERSQRENLQQKLLQLRSEHEERTTELESVSQRLRDTEQLAEQHASEAKTHRSVVMSGLEKLQTQHLSGSPDRSTDERVSVLQQQLQDARALVETNRADADGAAAKLRRAEERIAGLEAYQEQASRENLGVRKQVQEALRTAQMHQTQHAEVQQQLESQRRDASALSVQHSALKDLLDERAQSATGQDRTRNRDSLGGRAGSPETERIRELEQRLEESRRTHQETKSEFESRSQESERTYREKLEQLEQNYQSAISYVKGTEKMLKRMKDEHTKAKAANVRLQTELEQSLAAGSSSRSLESETPADWESERQALRREIEEMQESVKGSVFQLERQMHEVRQDLRAVEDERDHYRSNHEQTQQQLVQTTQQAQAELERLKQENVRLESRATDAESKVSLLLDQVEHSVDSYRRQSQPTPMNGIGPARDASVTSPTMAGRHSQSNSVSTDSAFPSGSPHERNSLALDSLASELETLRTQWEGTHRTYRLSSQFDFERTPTTAGGELSDSLANWRKRLDAEERDRDRDRDRDGGRVASPRGGETARDRARGDMVSPLRTHVEPDGAVNVI